MGREICRRTSTAMAPLWAELSPRERPGSVADKETDMCSIFDVNGKCVRKGVSVRSEGDRFTEKGTQLRLDIIQVCSGPHSRLSITQHQSPGSLVIALLTRPHLQVHPNLTS